MIKLGTYWVNPAAVIAIQDGAALLVTGDWITVKDMQPDAVIEALAALPNDPRAVAWDEGYSHAWWVQTGNPGKPGPTSNPYRKEALDG